MLGAQVQGGGTVKAKGGVAHHKVCTGAQGTGKIGQGSGGALQIFADQQHALHRVGQGGGQLRHQPELAVQLVFQCVLQRLMAAGRIHQQIGALGIGIHLLRQLFTLQGAVTCVHNDTPLQIVSMTEQPVQRTQRGGEPPAAAFVQVFQ